MGQKMAGATRRGLPIGVRLNDEERAELDEKMAARGITSQADYFRTLMHEDEGAR